MRKVHELIDLNEPAWPLIRSWIAASDRRVEVLPSARDRAEPTLLALQVTTRSALGALALETGGILVDDGWLRLLGSGNDRMKGDLLFWNGLGEQGTTAPLQNALVVAHDAVGGFFALNGGAWKGSKLGVVQYLAPDRLEWEDLRLSHMDLVRWAVLGDLTTFYSSMRWPEWRRDVAQMDGDHGISVVPPLFAAGPSLAERSRRIVPQHELWDFELDSMRQLAALPDGGVFRFKRPPGGEA